MRKQLENLTKALEDSKRESSKFKEMADIPLCKLKLSATSVVPMRMRLFARARVAARVAVMMTS